MIRCLLHVKNLVNGLSREWTTLGKYWKVAPQLAVGKARKPGKLESTIQSDSTFATAQTPEHFGGAAGDGNERGLCWMYAGLESEC